MSALWKTTKYGIAGFGLLMLAALAYNTAFMISDPEGYAAYQAEMAQEREARILEARQAAAQHLAVEQARAKEVEAVADEPKPIDRRVAASLCEEMVKTNVKDPDSFELLGSGVSSSDSARVLVNFRATNGFGAHITGQGACDIYTTGAVKLVSIR